MTALPAIASDGRGRKITIVALLAVGQAIAAGTAAFSTRDVFVALRDTGGALPAISLALIALSGMAIAGLRVSERVVAERVGQSYASDLRVKLFGHLSRVPVRVLAQRRSGALALRFVGDLSAVRNWVSLGVARLISASIVLPAAMLVLFSLNSKLGAAAVVPTLLGLGTMGVIGPKMGSIHRRLRERRASLAADMSERIPYAPELRLMGRMKTERRSLLENTQKMIASAIQRSRGTAIMRAVPDVVSGIAAASVLLVAFRSGASAAETAGILAAVGLMMQPMRDLAGVWDRHRAWIAAREKCLDVLRKPTVARPEAPDEPLVCAPQPLIFTGVKTKGLEVEGLKAQAGTMIALIGPNGAGKSTLLTLAAGLETPREGKVHLGDRAPASLSVMERKRMIAYVSSRSPILAGTLRRALTMGVAEKPCDTAILTIAVTYGLGNVVEKLGGLGGRISEGGRNLSSGEVRRVMLARAALSQAQLLLLDEPDDALDVEGANLVLRLLNRTSATVLLATHNPSIIQQLDEYWYLRDGRVVESGSTNALFEGDGLAAQFLSPKIAA